MNILCFWAIQKPQANRMKETEQFLTAHQPNSGTAKKERRTHHGGNFQRTFFEPLPGYQEGHSNKHRTGHGIRIPQCPFSPFLSDSLAFQALIQGPLYTIHTHCRRRGWEEHRWLKIPKQDTIADALHKQGTVSAGTGEGGARWPQVWGQLDNSMS